jgi:formate--tetrahydrofolate ligase
MPGNLYVALPGERVDGHTFIVAAIAAGARCVLAMHELSEGATLAAREAGVGVILVDDTSAALAKLAAYQADPETARLPVCIAKTQYSLSHDPKLLGRPKGWRMPVTDVLLYRGAGLVVPVAGEIKLMPGTSASPAYRRIDVDVETGKVRGLF